MNTTTFGHSLKALLGLDHAPSPEDIDQGAVLAELQAASDRLTSRLDDASLSRTDLIALAADLEPVARRLLQLRDAVPGANRGRELLHGQGHAVRLLDATLQDIYTSLYYIGPWRPYIWPEALKSRLWQVQHSLTQALVALHWQRIGVSARAG